MQPGGVTGGRFPRPGVHDRFAFQLPALPDGGQAAQVGLEAVQLFGQAALHGLGAGREPGQGYVRDVGDLGDAVQRLMPTTPSRAVRPARRVAWYRADRVRWSTLRVRASSASHRPSGDSTRLAITTWVCS